MNKAFSAFSLARKAGKLIVGYERVKEDVEFGNIDAVFIASDLSDKTVKNVRHFCKDLRDVYETALTQYDIAQITGKNRGVIAVKDENLKKLCLLSLNKEGE